ncbi:SDR family NAD(P)-dependent oxidoreductase [Xanthomonadaceae bacterium JHOS43]|nr:SDR family NAD(P)-dependent oxidoreductase [Xanthomonadaceae bacterium JHOS43]
MASQTHHALVTGASSGIGAAIAREYARRGVPLVLTARRKDRLEALAGELGAQVDCVAIAADLADPAAPGYLFNALAERGLRVGTLVNNAGYGVPGNYLSSSWETHTAFLRVMVTAASELTWRFLPQIRESGRGRILNVASFAGLMPGSNGQTLYAGAKSFLIRFTESLALENASHGVNACALCPGFTHSEFHDVTGTRALVSKLPRWMWLDTDEVARLGVDGVESGRVVVVPGTGYKLMRFACKHLPDALVRRMMEKKSASIRDGH